MINLLSAAPGVKVSTPAFGIDAIVGPSVNFNGDQMSYTFANQPSQTDTIFTMAAIVTMSGTAANSAILMNSGNAAGAQLNLPGPTFIGFVFPNGGTTIATTSIVSLTSGRSYFIAASFSVAASLLNAVVLDLSNGVIKSQSRPQTSTGMFKPNGTYRVGNASGSFQQTWGKIAAVAYLADFLSVPQLAQWAFDPWSFWYPFPSLSSLATT